MTYKTDSYTIKTAADIVDFLSFQGIKKALNNKYICPFCGSGSKKHKTPAFSIFTSKDGRGRYCCFSCNEQGDYYDLEKHFNARPQIITDCETQSRQSNPIDGNQPPVKNEYSPPEWDYIHLSNAALLGSETALFSLDEYHQITDYTNDSSNNWIKAAAYLSRRGIDETLIKNHFIGLSFDYYKNPFILFPLIDSNGKIKGTQNRYFKGEKVKQKQPKGQTGLNIWNEKAFNDDKPILIFEGIIDALTAYKVKELKGFDAIAINSTSYIKHFISFLQDKKPKNRLFACFDNDISGEKATNTIKTAYPNIETMNGFYKGFKDLNDFYLMKGV